jgi:hypothetical protein
MAKAKNENPKGSGRKTNLERMKINKINAEQAVDFVFNELELHLANIELLLLLNENPITFSQKQSDCEIIPDHVYSGECSPALPTAETQEPPPDPLTEQIKAALEKPAPATNVKGVLIIAGGHPFYGQMAVNLAASLRLSDSSVNIHLAYHGLALTHLDQSKKDLFSSMSLIPDEYLTHNGKVSYFKAKTHILDLSPFDETLFLDADMIWVSQYPVSKVFDSLSDIDFTISNRDRFDLEKGGGKYLWANVDEIKKTYGLTSGFIYSLHSEFIFFKKTERIKQYFETVKSIYENPKVRVVQIGGTVPDELAFAIASVIHNIYPHQLAYTPVYWHLTDSRKGTSLEYVTKNYMAYSIGGNSTPEVVRNRYNILAKSYANRLGILRPWTVIPKRRWLPERVKL